MSFLRTIGWGPRKKAVNHANVSNHPNDPQMVPGQDMFSPNHRQNPMKFLPNNPSNNYEIYNNNSFSPQQQQQLAIYLCEPYCRAQLVKGSIKTIVSIPPYISQEEWLALNVFEFYTLLNEFINLLSDHCTPRTCPTMSASLGIDYYWLDNRRKQVHLPASQYIEYVLTWMNNRISDRTIFPTRANVPFGPGFKGLVKSMFKQMQRVFAHLYHAHFLPVIHLSLEAHLNSLYAHFVTFCREYAMLDQQDTLPLDALIKLMEAEGFIK